jgi:hypothetical protein
LVITVDYVNITGYDNDIHVSILGRLSPHSEKIVYDPS